MTPSQSIYAEMDKLEAAYPDLCHKWKLSSWVPLSTTLYVYEITYPLGAGCYAIDDPKLMGEKTGILFITGIHGDEPLPIDGLVEAARHLLIDGRFALLHDLDPDYPINVISKYQLSHKRIANIMRSIDIFLLPVANPNGFDKGQRLIPKWWPKKDVDLDRNFDTLWNGTRDGINNYFLSGQPPGWDANNPGSSAGSEDETQLIKKLMSEFKIIAYVNIHSDQQRQMTYPWGFEQNGIDMDQRYCNPAFATLSATPHTTFNPLQPLRPYYQEFVPNASLGNITSFPNNVATQVNAASGYKYPTDIVHQCPACNTKLPYTVHQDNKSLTTLPDPQKPHLGAIRTPIDDPCGGTSQDYFYSLDPCNALTFHMEVGTSVSSTPDTVKTDVIAAVFAACDDIFTRVEQKGTPLQRFADQSRVFPLPCR
jgi:hypothetical protein